MVKFSFNVFSQTILTNEWALQYETEHRLSMDEQSV